jgi:predicted TPR repeat methyltransferase
MDKYEETFNTWDKAANSYEEKFMSFGLYNDTYQFFIENISSTHPSVLEIGCGPGNIAKYLLNVKPNLRLSAIDASLNMIRLASSNNPSARCMVLDCRRIHELPEKYNGIIGGFVIPYLSPEDVLKLIKDCSDLLTNDGVLYLSFVEGDETRSGFQTGSSGGRVYFYYHNISFIEKAFNESGLTMIRVFRKEYRLNELPETHTVLLAKKTNCN